MVVSVLSTEGESASPLVDEIDSSKNRVTLDIDVNDERIAMPVRLGSTHSAFDEGLQQWDMEIVFPRPTAGTGFSLRLGWPERHASIIATWNSEEIQAAQRASEGMPVPRVIRIPR